MGFSRQGCEFLFHIRKRYGIAWGSTLTLGRQQMFISPKEARAMAESFALPFALKEDWRSGTGYCEPFISALGAGTIDSMDASDYEDATIIHDLNVPVSAELHGKYDCIIDGGTIEHVFHFPNAIRSCMDMLAPGGHYIGITPADNQMGHGFYQFSPELYFRIFVPANGFEVRTMLLQTPSEWLEIRDPEVVGHRGTLTSSTPLMLAILARKTSSSSSEFHIPQQSDYQNAWSIVESIRSDSKREGESTIRHMVRKHVPVPLKTMLRKVVRSFSPKLGVDGLRRVDRDSYRRIRIQD
ncbi:MAG TPA: hypothetical protein PLV70_01930 [Flavobacteriales bacterium]|nr:hypothetical protein [Flavobacteriales bacterium]HRQ83853.1 hypothetical protein [Flavobacteriales bacterium]